MTPERSLTIPEIHPSPAEDKPDPQTLALAALGWMLEDGDRADRFLSLTGLSPDSLRAGIAGRVMQAAVLDFLSAHEPDLIRAAEALAVTPEELVDAAAELRR